MKKVICFICVIAIMLSGCIYDHNRSIDDNVDKPVVEENIQNNQIDEQIFEEKEELPEDNPNPAAEVMQVNFQGKNLATETDIDFDKLPTLSKALDIMVAYNFSYNNLLKNPGDVFWNKFIDTMILNKQFHPFSDKSDSMIWDNESVARAGSLLTGYELMCSSFPNSVDLSKTTLLHIYDCHKDDVCVNLTEEGYLKITYDMIWACCFDVLSYGEISVDAVLMPNSDSPFDGFSILSLDYETACEPEHAIMQYASNYLNLENEADFLRDFRESYQQESECDISESDEPELVHDTSKSAPPELEYDISVAENGIVPLNKISNLNSIKKKCTDAEIAQAYSAALNVVSPLVGLPQEEQLYSVMSQLRTIFETTGTYSMSNNHYNDPYGYLIAGTASCAGSARTTILCLKMLGYSSVEHVHENQYCHQWARVLMNDGSYWICDPFGLYCGPEPAPYIHPESQ